MKNLAVILMTFNRPHYFEQVLQSVLNQTPMLSRELSYYMFQDGGCTALNNFRVESDEILAKSPRIFKSYLPKGEIHISEHNLGVALNFDRAERFIFEKMEYEEAIFLEDDLILESNYFRLIESLLDSTEGRPEIGMVSARGFSNFTSLQDQLTHINRVCLMDEHNWGFALKRDAWKARDQIVKRYIHQMMNMNYRDRDKGFNKQVIHSFQRAHARNGNAFLTSQDSIKNMAMKAQGIFRITTYTNNARYIGREGLHSTYDKFERKGHSKASICPCKVVPHFSIPSKEHLLKMETTF